MGVGKTLHVVWTRDVVNDSRLGTRAIWGIGAGALGSIGAFPGKLLFGCAGRPIHLEISVKTLGLLLPGSEGFTEHAVILTKHPVLLGKGIDCPVLSLDVTVNIPFTKHLVLLSKGSDHAVLVLQVTLEHSHLPLVAIVLIHFHILDDLDGTPPALRGLCIGTAQHMEKAGDDGGILGHANR
jgi:hypothetical protein